MYVFPAIDIYQGRVVRLTQGDYERVTVYEENPLDQAQRWVEAGASWLHIVDLDGAKTGIPYNLPVISAIAREFDVRIEVGGGVRSFNTAQALLEAGVERVVLGTKLANDTEFVRELVEEFGPSRLVAGVDSKGGRAATSGWTTQSSTDALDLVSQLADMGLRHLVFTDIARDGMQSGIDLELYRTVARRAGFPVIVSGGIATLADLEQIRVAGDDVVEGVITGRALYEHAFSLRDAIATLEGGVAC